MKLRHSNVFVTVEEAKKADLIALSTALTIPAKNGVEPEHLFDLVQKRFLSGLLPLVETVLGDQIEEVLDLPSKGAIEEIPLDLLDGITLRGYQASAISKALYHKRGIVSFPTASGKTELAAGIAATLEQKYGIGCLVVVPGISSATQTAERFQLRGVADVGRYVSRYKETNHKHIVGGIAALHRAILREDPALIKWIDTQCGCIMLMECQHTPANTWEMLASVVDVPYRFGLSATPFQSARPTTDRDFRLIGVTGEVISRCADATLMDRDIMAVPKVHFIQVGGPNIEGLMKSTIWQKVKTHGVVGNEIRNRMLSRIASDLALTGNQVLLLVQEVGHGTAVASAISSRIHDGLELGGEDIRTYFFRGGGRFSRFDAGTESQVERVEISEVSERLSGLDGYVLIGSPALDEDVDFPEMNVLISGGAGRSFIKIIQRAGRVLRAKPGANTCHIIDVDDRCSYVLKAQSRERRKLYEERYRGAKGFSICDYVDPIEIVRAVNTVEVDGGRRASPGKAVSV